MVEEWPMNGRLVNERHMRHGKPQEKPHLGLRLAVLLDEEALKNFPDRHGVGDTRPHRDARDLEEVGPHRLMVEEWPIDGRVRLLVELWTTSNGRGMVEEWPSTRSNRLGHGRGIVDYGRGMVDG